MQCTADSRLSRSTAHVSTHGVFDAQRPATPVDGALTGEDVDETSGPRASTRSHAAPRVRASSAAETNHVGRITPQRSRLRNAALLAFGVAIFLPALAAVCTVYVTSLARALRRFGPTGALGREQAARLLRLVRPAPRTATARSTSHAAAQQLILRPPPQPRGTSANRAGAAESFAAAAPGPDDEATQAASLAALTQILDPGDDETLAWVNIEAHAADVVGGKPHAQPPPPAAPTRVADAACARQASSRGPGVGPNRAAPSATCPVFVEEFDVLTSRLAPFVPTRPEPVPGAALEALLDGSQNASDAWAPVAVDRPLQATDGALRREDRNLEASAAATPQPVSPLRRCRDVGEDAPRGRATSRGDASGDAARRARTPSPHQGRRRNSFDTSPGESVPSLSPSSSHSSACSQDEEISLLEGPRVHHVTDGSGLARVAQRTAAAPHLDARGLVSPAALQAGSPWVVGAASFEVSDPLAVATTLQASLRGRAAERLRASAGGPRADTLPKSEVDPIGLLPVADTGAQTVDAFDESCVVDAAAVDRYFGRPSGWPANCVARAPGLRHQLGMLSVQRGVRALFGHKRGSMATAIARQSRGDRRWATQLAAVADEESFADLRATLNLGIGASLHMGELRVSLPRPTPATQRFVLFGAAEGGHSVELGLLYPRFGSKMLLNEDFDGVEVMGHTYVGARLHVRAPRDARPSVELSDLWLASEAVPRARSYRPDARGAASLTPRWDAAAA